MSETSTESPTQEGIGVTPIATSRNRMSNPWLVGSVVGIVITILAVVASAPGNSNVEGREIVHVISWMLLVPLIAYVMRRFAGETGRFPTIWKVIALSIFFAIVTMIAGGMEFSLYTIFMPFYISWMAVPAANGRWKTFLFAAALPLIPFMIQVAVPTFVLYLVARFMFSGGGDESSYSPHQMSLGEAKQRAQDASRYD